MRIGIVANESSGDQLGAGLIQAILHRIPHATFEGVGGIQMCKAGCNSLIPIESLSVMGLVEIIHHLPRLLRLRRQLIRHFLYHPPDVFIGIDAPDFNLKLEQHLRIAGIPTVHYVSPTIWAWRSNRIHAIRRSVDLVLSIFPFEIPILQQHNIPAIYVGHPLAQTISLEHDQIKARIELNLPVNQPILAILPGSRNNEALNLTAIFLHTALWCQTRIPNLHCVTPLVNNTIRQIVTNIKRQIAPNLPLTLINGNSHQVLTAANVVLTASGTATLEAMLHQRPMVVAYRLHPITYWLATTFNLVKTPYIALSNLLAEEALAPEFIQHHCIPQDMGQAILKFFHQPKQVRYIQQRYLHLHQQLRCNSNERAADAILELICAKSNKHETHQ